MPRFGCWPSSPERRFPDRPAMPPEGPGGRRTVRADLALSPHLDLDPHPPPNRLGVEGTVSVVEAAARARGLLAG